MPRRKNNSKIKLDIKGLRAITKTLGKKTEFSVGLFNKVSIRKGAALEFGLDENEDPKLPNGQIARPWLSQVFNGKTGEEINGVVVDFVRSALNGDTKTSKKKAQIKITHAVQDILLDQSFDDPVEDLLYPTVERKKKAKKSFPDKVGLGSFTMANSIRTKYKRTR